MSVIGLMIFVPQFFFGIMALSGRRLAGGKVGQGDILLSFLLICLNQWVRGLFGYCL